MFARIIVLTATLLFIAGVLPASQPESFQPASSSLLAGPSPEYDRMICQDGDESSDSSSSSDYSSSSDPDPEHLPEVTAEDQGHEEESPSRSYSRPERDPEALPEVTKQDTGNVQSTELPQASRSDTGNREPSRASGGSASNQRTVQRPSEPPPDMLPHFRFGLLDALLVAFVVAAILGFVIYKNM